MRDCRVLREELLEYVAAFIPDAAISKAEDRGVPLSLEAGLESLSCGEGVALNGR